MNQKIKVLKAAFPLTIPVMTGYLFLGTAYGILMSGKGLHLGWILLISLFVFAGSMQFVGVTLLTSLFHPLNALLMTLMVNARHLFYGISMLEKYRGLGRRKPYIIFGLTDETFSIVCSQNPPEGVDKELFLFYITGLNQCYWVIGSLLGGILGSLITFEMIGLDFALTALFIVIFVNQWLETKTHGPALIGVIVSAACVLIFGADQFIIPAMVLILVVLTLLKKRIGRAQL